jgi:hypothetical protein
VRSDHKLSSCDAHDNIWWLACLAGPRQGATHANPGSPDQHLFTVLNLPKSGYRCYRIALGGVHFALTYISR